MTLFGGRPDVGKLEGKHDLTGLTKALGYEKDYSGGSRAAEALGRAGAEEAMATLCAGADSG